MATTTTTTISLAPCEVEYGLPISPDDAGYTVQVIKEKDATTTTIVALKPCEVEDALPKASHDDIIQQKDSATIPLRPYEVEYALPSGPGDARPTALQIIQDNDLVGKWAGKVCLVTGATSSIGLETVRALRATGADVYFTARDETKGKTTVEDVLETHEQGGILQYIIMEADSLDSVRAAAKEFLAQSNELHVLINNAGIMATPYGLTKDGIEQQFGVNHLSHVLLTHLLLPALQNASTPHAPSRIIQVSSTAHRWSSVNFDLSDFTPDALTYNPYVAYGQSKTAMIWTASYLDRVYGPSGVRAFSTHPGGVMSKLLAGMDPEVVAEWAADPAVIAGLMTAEQGAAMQVWAAVGCDAEEYGGKYLVSLGEAEPAKKVFPFQPADMGYAPFIYNEEKEDRLWAESLKLATRGREG